MMLLFTSIVSKAKHNYDIELTSPTPPITPILLKGTETSHPPNAQSPHSNKQLATQANHPLPTTRTTNTSYEVFSATPSSLHEHNSPSPEIKIMGPLTPTLIMNPSFYIPPPYPFPECWKALPEGSGATPWMACKGITPHKTQEIPPKKQDNNEEEAHYKAFLGFAIHG